MHRNLLFPNEVAGETYDWYKDEGEIKYKIRPQARYNAIILCGKPDGRGDDSIKREKKHREDE
jgi:hypothetical protein